MKRIVILHCLYSNSVCTGAGCLKAFNKKQAPLPDMVRNRWSWKPFGAATAVATAVLSIRRVSKKNWSVLSA